MGGRTVGWLMVLLAVRYYLLKLIGYLWFGCSSSSVYWRVIVFGILSI